MSRRILLPSIGATALCVFTLSACSGGPAPASPLPDAGAAQAVMADPPQQDIQCGTVPAMDGRQAKVAIRQGAVECAEAVTLLTQYFARVTPADAANPSGAGPIALQSWTCGSDAGTVLTATCSTEDGRQVDAQPAG